jgi:hypothetical protein
LLTQFDYKIVRLETIKDQLLQSVVGLKLSGKINEHSTHEEIFKHKFYYCISIRGRQKAPWPPSLAFDMPW